MSNLVLHLVSNPMNMTKEMHRVMKPGSIGYFSVLCDYNDSSIFSTFPELYKKYGFKGPNRRPIHYLSEDSDLKKVFDEKQFQILSIEKINLVMEPNETIINWNSLENFKFFVDTLDETSKANLIKEHAQKKQEILSKTKPYTFYMKAIFVKRI